MEDNEINGTTKLILFTLFILIIYLMFFNFNLERAYQYTVDQVLEFIKIFK